MFDSDLYETFMRRNNTVRSEDYAVGPYLSATQLPAHDRNLNCGDSAHAFQIAPDTLTLTLTQKERELDCVCAPSVCDDDNVTFSDSVDQFLVGPNLHGFSSGYYQHGSTGFPDRAQSLYRERTLTDSRIGRGLGGGPSIPDKPDLFRSSKVGLVGADELGAIGVAHHWRHYRTEPGPACVDNESCVTGNSGE